MPAGVSALKFYVHVVILCLVTQDSLLFPSLISSKFILFLVVEDSAPKDYFFFFFFIKSSEASEAGG